MGCDQYALCFDPSYLVLDEGPVGLGGAGWGRPCLRTLAGARGLTVSVEVGEDGADLIGE